MSKQLRPPAVGRTTETQPPPTMDQRQAKLAGAAEAGRMEYMGGMPPDYLFRQIKKLLAAKRKEFFVTLTGNVKGYFAAEAPQTGSGVNIGAQHLSGGIVRVFFILDVVLDVQLA